MLFSLDATGSFGSVTRGQCAAKISYVLRPSSSAWDCSVCSMMSLPIISSQYFTDQPPCSKPPSRSSSGPPGACMTPSTVRNVPTTSFLMCLSSGHSPSWSVRDVIASLNLKPGPPSGGSDIAGHHRTSQTPQSKLTSIPEPRSNRVSRPRLSGVQTGSTKDGPRPKSPCPRRRSEARVRTRVPVPRTRVLVRLRGSGRR